MGIMTLLFKNKLLIVAILLSIVMIGFVTYIKILRGNVTTLEAQKETLIIELQISNNSVKRLQESINTQNLAIDKLKIEADKRLAAGRVEIEKARTRAGTYKKQAEDLLKSTPLQSQSKCDAANQLINKEIKNAK